MVKNYWRQICYAPDGATGGDATSQNTAKHSATKEGEDNSDITFSIEESQGLEAIDESFLMGHDPEAETAKAADTSKKDDSKKDDSKADDTAAKASAREDAADSQSKDDTKDDKSSTESKSASSESKDDDSKESEKDDSQKPPKGYVPLAAVQEARNENKFLKEQLKALQESKAPAKKEEAKEEAPKSNVPDGFKVLSNAEFKELADDDPTEALLYMQNLNIYQEEQRQAQMKEQQEALRARDEADNKAKLQSIFNETTKKMEEFVPGLFDEDSKAHEELAEFAKDLGFTDDMYYLTNPETQIILPGDTKPLLLGEQAASVIQTLATARNKINELSKAVDKEAIEKEVEARLRKEIEAEFLTKFKKSSSEDEFRSLDQVPSTETADFSGKVLSMAELNKLSVAEQEAYLSGA
jgi:hypothetical protein